ETRYGTGSNCSRPLRVSPLDIRAGRVRRLLRRLVGDSRTAYAADVGDECDFFGDRGRRAARGRCRVGRQRRRPLVGACARFRRLDVCFREYFRRIPGHPTHVGDVSEEKEVTTAMIDDRTFATWEFVTAPDLRCTASRCTASGALTRSAA